MKYAPLVFLVSTAVLFGCTSTSTSTTASTTTVPVSATNVSSSVQSAATYINAERAQRGLAALSVDARLTQAAQLHTNYMASSGKFSHTGQGGSSVKTRVAAQGYKGCFWAENIASGYSSGQDVTNGWMNSRQHRDNILNGRVTNIGIGNVDGLWTAVFAQAC